MDAVLMDAQVVRWRKYGKDRLYVNADDGTKTGYHDVLTGLDHVATAEHAVTFQAALVPWHDAEVDAEERAPCLVSDVVQPASEACVAGSSAYGRVSVARAVPW